MMNCPGTWPIDYLGEHGITHGELACTRVKGHIGLCEARDPDTGRTLQFPGLMTSRDSPVPHDYEYIGDEYGSLADGGSYEEYRCRRCGRHVYSPLPD